MAASLWARALEVLFLHRPLIPALAIPMAALFVLSNVLRWWVIQTLAGQWNVEVMDSSRVGVVSSGPYRWVRHPNYVAVVAEVFSLPMIHTAWITSIAGTLGDLAILRRRLRVEDGVLLSNPPIVWPWAKSPGSFLECLSGMRKRPEKNAPLESRNANLPIGAAQN